MQGKVCKEAILYTAAKFWLEANWGVCFFAKIRAQETSSMTKLRVDATQLLAKYPMADQEWDALEEAAAIQDIARVNSLTTNLLNNANSVEDLVDKANLIEDMLPVNLRLYINIVNVFDEWARPYIPLDWGLPQLLEGGYKVSEITPVYAGVKSFQGDVTTLEEYVGSNVPGEWVHILTHVNAEETFEDIYRTYYERVVSTLAVSGILCASSSVQGSWLSYGPNTIGIVFNGEALHVFNRDMHSVRTWRGDREPHPSLRGDTRIEAWINPQFVAVSNLLVHPQSDSVFIHAIKELGRALGIPVDIDEKEIGQNKDALTLPSSSYTAELINILKTYSVDVATYGDHTVAYCSLDDKINVGNAFMDILEGSGYVVMTDDELIDKPVEVLHLYQDSTIYNYAVRLIHDTERPISKFVSALYGDPELYNQEYFVVSQSFYSFIDRLKTVDDLHELLPPWTAAVELFQNLGKFLGNEISKLII